MLIEFRVENHRSFREEQALTLQVGHADDQPDPRCRVVPGSSKAVLTAAGIYGANASGKSNLLSALWFMRKAVVHSHRSWPADGGVPRDPFAWGLRDDAPSMFEALFLVDSVRFQYGFVVDNKKVLEEWLYAWPNGRKQTWFRREEEDFKFGSHLKGENRLVEKATRENALFLSAAAQNAHRQLGPVHRWFSGIRGVNLPGERSGVFNRLFHQAQLRDLLIDPLSGDPASQDPASEDPSFGTKSERATRPQLQAFRSLVQAADLGITNFKLTDERFEDGRGQALRRSILVGHQSRAGEAWLPLEQESKGTQTLLQMGPALVESLQTGGVLLVDELEASLHPLLALHLLKYFGSQASNPKNAQILFTTHDTNLLGSTLGEAALRADQVWLTEKNDEGATVLVPLSDYKLRKGQNLERGYLQGRFSAVPFLGPQFSRQG